MCSPERSFDVDFPGDDPLLLYQSIITSQEYFPSSLSHEERKRIIKTLQKWRHLNNPRINSNTTHAPDTKASTTDTTHESHDNEYDIMDMGLSAYITVLQNCEEECLRYLLATVEASAANVQSQTQASLPCNDTRLIETLRKNVNSIKQLNTRRDKTTHKGRGGMDEGRKGGYEEWKLHMGVLYYSLLSTIAPTQVIYYISQSHSIHRLKTTDIR